MAEIDLGKIAPIGKGDYISSNTYENLDIVRELGVSYIATTNIDVNENPSAFPLKWKVLVKDGIDGTSSNPIKGIATQSNAPTPYDSVTYPNGLFETYVVRTPLTIPNSWGSAVTQDELDANNVYFDVKNGVITKSLSKKTNGDSAYQIAVKNGFVGTEEEWLESLGANPNTEIALSSFLKGSVLQEDGITMPQTNATDGKFLLPSLNPANAIDGEWGYIEPSQLAGYDSITIKGDMASLGNCTYLTVKKANGTFENLINNSALTNVTVPIDHTAQIYIYSRFKNATFFFKNKTVSQGIEEDGVKKYIDEKTSGISVDGVGVFKPENYGAEVLDPRNPDSGKDCTDAFNNMFVDMFTNYPTINSYRVVMAGVYRIGGAPVYEKGQINIPFNANVDWNFKSVYFEGLTRPSLTDRGNNNTMNPLLGSGFYSSYIYTGSDYRHIIRIGEGSNFGLRVGHVFMNNIACYIKTHGTNNESIANNMSGFDFSNLSTFAFTDIYAITTSAGLNTREPAMNAIGLIMPRANNMASVYGNSLKIMGFGVGAILTEHLNLNHLIAVFNKDGVQVQNTYPINVGNATLEHNLCHVRMYPNSAVNFGVFQTEDINDTQYWFNRTDKMIKGVASSRVTMGQTMSHVWGGGAIPLTYDPEIKLRYLMDESGNSKLD